MGINHLTSQFERDMTLAYKTWDLGKVQM